MNAYVAILDKIDLMMIWRFVSECCVCVLVYYYFQFFRFPWFFNDTPPLHPLNWNGQNWIITVFRLHSRTHVYFVSENKNCSKKIHYIVLQSTDNMIRTFFSTALIPSFSIRKLFMTFDRFFFVCVRSKKKKLQSSTKKVWRPYELYVHVTKFFFRLCCYWCCCCYSTHLRFYLFIHSTFSNTELLIENRFYHHMVSLPLFSYSSYYSLCAPTFRHKRRMYQVISVLINVFQFWPFNRVKVGKKFDFKFTHTHTLTCSRRKRSCLQSLAHQSHKIR